MIKVEYAVKVLREFLELHGPELLPLKIVQIGEEHSKRTANDSHKISEKDAVIIGLRYYEFLTDGTSDQDYCNACDFAEKLRNKFEIDYEWLTNECKKLGWH